MTMCANSTEETLKHLFLDCEFARNCWALIHLDIHDQTDPFQILENFKNQLFVPFIHGVDHLVILKRFHFQEHGTNHALVICRAKKS